VRRFRFDGFEVLAGATVSGNEEVTFRLATPDDLWLHARGVPGAHVVIRSGGRRVPEHVVRQAASLAAFYSRARDEGVAAVDVCERRHVRRPRGAPPGLVTYVQERTVRVAPSAPSTPPADAARSAS
ncbi:MAG TPA: NFACT RNA binding domain-containing protein, partial [Chloroflexota bacterium]